MGVVVLVAVGCGGGCFIAVGVIGRVAGPVVWGLLSGGKYIIGI